MIATRIAAALVVALAACNSGPMQPQREQAMAAAAESSGAAAQAEKKANLTPGTSSDVQQHPDKFLQWSALHAVTRGLLTETSQLTELTVLNTSRFGVADLQGMVSWVDVRGNVLPMTTQLALSGSIAPGESVTFAMGKGIAISGTIVGKGTPQRITFTNATIEPP
jgi:hypothetical protein